MSEGNKIYIRKIIEEKKVRMIVFATDISKMNALCWKEMAGLLSHNKKMILKFLFAIIRVKLMRRDQCQKMFVLSVIKITRNSLLTSIFGHGFLEPLYHPI